MSSYYKFVTIKEFPGVSEVPLGEPTLPIFSGIKNQLTLLCSGDEQKSQ